MERTLTPVPLAIARAAIARKWLDPEREAPERAGAITLREHQREAVARVRSAIEEFGGALLADAVGLGKTYVAAALAREYRDTLVVCPAALRDMWTRALAAASVAASICSYSELSRGREPALPVGLLVLDEAHHARTPSTRRYCSLTHLAQRARVLALSATPIHNAREDVLAVLALFLGARAWTMSDAELARCVVRREHADVRTAAMPALGALEWLSTSDDADLLHEIMQLPPPVAPAGGGDGGALIALGLVRQWASSRAALEGALHRRLARAAGLGAALEAGFHPSDADLHAWTAGDDAIQLAFPSLMAAPLAEPAPLIDALRAHERALRALLDRSRASSAPDDARAEQLRALRRRHTGARIVAFSSYADTVRAFFRRLAPDGRAAALTGRGARIAGGTITRREALARFAPRATGSTPPRDAERIDLLLTTDLLSEGLDLSDASVVVHLDLPWTPARMEQRVGRSCRLGAPHERTFVYAFAPPAAAETVLAIERRLRAKLATAGRVAGIAGAILPTAMTSVPTASSATSQRERIHRVISAWQRSGEAQQTFGPIIATVHGVRLATLALVEHDSQPLLAGALDDDELSTAPAVILEVLGAIEAAADAAPDSETWIAAHARAEQFAERMRAGAAVEGRELFHAASRRNALRRLAAITKRAPLHQRAMFAPLAAAARSAITARFGIGAEHVLGDIAAAPLADEAWLRALAEFGTIHVAAATPHSDAVRLVALIVSTTPSPGSARRSG